MGAQLLCRALALARHHDAQSFRARGRLRCGPRDRVGRHQGSQWRIHGTLVRHQVTICLVTDRRQLSPGARTVRDEASALIHWLEEAITAGVDLIQIREPDLPARLLADVSRAVAAGAAGSSTRVVVNDRADVAIACGCDGVHLRGDGPPIGRVRDFVARSGFQDRETRNLLTGRSVHSVEEAQVHADADYLVFGAVYDSGSKPGRGLEALRAVASVARAETVGRGFSRAGVIAIGGITVPRAAECLAAGATGVAAIRIFLPPGRAEGALGVTEATQQLRGAFDAAATGHLQ